MDEKELRKLAGIRIDEGVEPGDLLDLIEDIYKIYKNMNPADYKSVTRDTIKKNQRGAKSTFDFLLDWASALETDLED